MCVCKDGRECTCACVRMGSVCTHVCVRMGGESTCVCEDGK